MSFRQGPSFSTDDLMTRVIPGAIPIVVFAITTFPTIRTDSLNSTGIILGFLITSFLVGEISDIFRDTLTAVPASFRRVLFREFGTIEILPRRDRFSIYLLQLPNKHIFKLIREIPNFRTIHVKTIFDGDETRSFRGELASTMDVEERSATVHHIFYLLFSMVEPEFSSRTRKYYRTYRFHRNSTVACGFGFVTSSVGMLMEIEGTAMAAVLFLVLIYFLSFIFGGVADKFIDSLILEFYKIRVSIE